MLVSEVVFHELRKVGGLVDGQVDEGPVPNKVALSVEHFCGWGLEGSHISALTEVILNGGHVVGQVGADFDVVQVAVFSFGFDEVQN